MEKEQKEKGKEKEKAKAPTPEIQIFDYATAPNILDDVPPVEESDVRQTIRGARRGRGGGKRGKKRGALFLTLDHSCGPVIDAMSCLGGLDHGNFGPTPRAMNEPKSGNKMQTF